LGEKRKTAHRPFGRKGEALRWRAKNPEKGPRGEASEMREKSNYHWLKAWPEEERGTGCREGGAGGETAGEGT